MEVILDGKGLELVGWMRQDIGCNRMDTDVQVSIVSCGACY